jgi:arylsulfatase
MKKNRVVLILQFAILLLVFSCSAPAGDVPPNIVLIFIDDQGYADLGCYRAKEFDTPNIDQLAEEGIRFTSFYASEAVCSASRASLLTGCYAQRVSIRGALNPVAYTGLHPEETTIASMLRSRGYKTAIFGKWHLGHRLEFLPVNFGFDEYFGLTYSNDMWPVDYDGLPLTGGYRALYPTLCLIEDSVCIREVTTLADQSQLTRLYTQRAIDFINRNQKDPFFLYLPHSMVHVPIAASETFAGSSKQGMFGDVMQEIDWSVGEIRRELEDLGLLENTLIIYASDNGPWLNYGNHAGSAEPFREGKGTAWEGGVRVPGIMTWPGHIQPGRTTGQMASTLDVLPTLAAITGAPKPEKKIDGYDLSGLLLSDSIDSPRKSFIYFYEGGLRAVREGRWKLMLPHKSRSYEGLEPGADGWPGPTKVKEIPLALYDLETDPGEQTNVRSGNPEITEHLLAVADSIREILGDDLTGIKGKEVRPCGRVGSVQDTEHLGRDKSISLVHSPAGRYQGDGPSTLVNGTLGSLDFHDDNWLGFRVHYLDVTIDLGKETNINEITLRFLQNQTSWIFLPRYFSVLISSDGLDFTTHFEESYEASKQNMNIKIETYTVPVERSTRFIRIIADGVNPCPYWHPGNGSPGWLFVDEIVLR